MKKMIFSGILLLSVLAGCIYDEGPDCDNDTGGGTYLAVRSSHITFPTANDEGEEAESITLNSLRIIVFSQATGRVVTNKVFDISDHTPPSAENDWVVDFSDIVVETKPGQSIVYVILNEDVSAVSGKSLAGELNKLSTLAEMNALVNTPLSYADPLRVEYESDGVTPKEPPFIMSTFGECTIPEGRPIENPYLADLRGPSEGQMGFELDRTMAKVTIESVSNYPMYEGQETDNVATSYIFILKMGLVNVPMKYLWSPNRPQTDGYPVPAYEGSYQTLDFGLEDPDAGYYDRDWSGNIRLNINADAYEVEELKDSRIWYTGRGSGSDSYSIYKHTLDTNIKNNINNISDKVFPSTYPGGIITVLEINHGNFFNFVRDLYAHATGGDYLPTWYELKEPYTLTPNVTGGYWELTEKNISYYVPEHILSDKTSPTSATKLYVKAATASIPTDITKEMSYNIHWNEATWGEWKYSITPGGTTSITQAQMNALWGYELDTIRHPKTGADLVIIRHYWKGAIRYRNGHATGTLDGVQFANIAGSSDTKEFYLPICNTPVSPVDYNIYRNHEYRFSVHVIEAWGQQTLSSRVATGDNIVLQMK